MTTIYLVRHAEAEGNVYRRIHGWYDALITDNGFRQIAALERRFQDVHVDAVYSSDLYRTMTTARAVYRPKGLELHTDPRLREIHMGVWEDIPWGEAYHFHLEDMRRFNHSDPTWQVEGSDTFAAVGQRVCEALYDIARSHPDQTVAVFSHGTAIRQALSDIKGLTPEEWRGQAHGDNTSVSCLAFENDRFHVIYEIDNSHLGDELSTLGKQAWWRKESKQRDVNMWYRPLDWKTEEEIYLEARREAWTSTHGSGVPFDGESFLRDARLHLEQSPWGVTVAMADNEIAGLIQLDTQRYSQDNAGYIPFFYLMPERRAKGLGVQLIGQAVSYFRPMGRDKLRLRCAPYNTTAKRFYEKYGFVKVGEEQGSRVPLDIMEKYIGYDR